MPRANPTCTTCHGTGLRPDDVGQLTVYCPCVRAVRIRRAIDSVTQLHGVRNNIDTPLAPRRADGGTRYPLQRHAIVRADLPTFRSALAGWITIFVQRYDAEPRLRYMTSPELVSMWLGHDPATGEQRPASCLSTLRGHDLVVIEVLSSRPAAAPALLELVSTWAQTRDRRTGAVSTMPVFLMHPPGNTFGEGHPAWSAELARYLEGCEEIDLCPETTQRTDPLGVL